MIDLRSDTVTKPSSAMRKAMYEAEVGDDVYKEDPTVNELEEFSAALFGKEAALFVPSGVMGNQLCLKVLTNPFDEVILDKDAHIIHYESGSPAVLSGIQLYPVDGHKGAFTAEQIEPIIRPASAYYMPRTRVIAIENTHNRAGGTIYPFKEIEKISLLAKQYKLAMHLDGARIWNASVVSGISLKKYASNFDTVSCCLSKGLGAPIGSLVISTKKNIDDAYRYRKAFGGGMRQVGIIAAAGLYALRHNIERLNEDHQNAKRIAAAIAEHPAFEIDFDSVETNILSFKSKKYSIEEVISALKENGIMISVGAVGYLRAVTHLDISQEDVEKVIKVINKIF